MKTPRPATSDNIVLVRKLVIVVIGMFAFGFAMVPFYEKICAATGLRNIASADEVSNTQVDRTRSIRIELDANLHKLPWNFRPLQTVINVHPGEVTQVLYEIQNTTERQLTGQAIPSYGPQQAAQYFKKLECFCFAKQTFGAREKRQMPVVFVIDPALPKEINTITLSYTFFEVEGADKG